MSPRISRADRAKKLSWWRRAAGLAAIVFLLLAGGTNARPTTIRVYVVCLLIAVGAWASLKGAQFIIVRYFYEYEVGIGYRGRYAVAVGWTAVCFGVLLMTLGVLGLFF